MKMVALGTGKVESILEIMGTNAAGLGWEDNLMMVPQSGKKWYASCFQNKYLVFGFYLMWLFLVNKIGFYGILQFRCLKFLSPSYIILLVLNL